MKCRALRSEPERLCITWIYIEIAKGKDAIGMIINVERMLELDEDLKALSHDINATFNTGSGKLHAPMLLLPIA